MNYIIAVLLVNIILISSLQTVRAENVSGEVRTLVQDTDILSEASEGGTVTASLKSGDYVFVTGESGDYYVVYYKGNTGYIPRTAIDGTPDSSGLASSARASEQSSIEAVSSELELEQQANETYTESLERQRTAQRNAMYWKIIIGSLVTAMIAVTIISAVRKARADHRSDDNGDDE